LNFYSGLSRPVGHQDGETSSVFIKQFTGMTDTEKEEIDRLFNIYNKLYGPVEDDKVDTSPCDGFLQPRFSVELKVRSIDNYVRSHFPFSFACCTFFVSPQS
jgi:hypothetical protein